MDKKDDFKSQILNGSLANRAFFRVIVLASAISIVSLLRTLDLGSLAPTNNYDDCVAHSISDSTLNPGSYLFQSRILNNFWGTFDSMNCKQDLNLTMNVISDLMGKHYLNCSAKSLCIGEASPMAVMAMQQLGFTSVTGIRNPHLFSLKHKNNFLHHLHFHHSSFDFVFSRDLDKVSVPALLVLESERILKPGGIGAILVPTTATPAVSSLLRSSSVVHVASVNQLNLVVFKKISQNTTTSLFFFYEYAALPANCPSVSFTKPLIDMMEPLVEERTHDYEKRMLYLPNFVDVSSRKRLVYIDIGNVSDSFLPSYPIQQTAFSVYYVHYNTSILSSYVKRPGTTFIYHPGLDGKEKDTGSAEEDLNPFVGKEEFDLLVWFKETVKYADFVVLKMNVGKVEMKFLSDIFENGAICSVDELFLGCPDGKGMKKKEEESCMNMYKGLRSNGVYVHQWWEM